MRPRTKPVPCRWILAGGLVLLAGCYGSPSTAPVVARHESPSGAKATEAQPEPSPGAEAAVLPAHHTNHAEISPREAAADRPRRSSSANEREPIAVTFEDLNMSMQMDIAFRPWMLTDRVKELEGKRIKIKGVIEGPDRQKRVKSFVLLKNKECKFGPGGQADHLAQIEMQGDASVNFTDRPVEVEGVLRIEPFQGPDQNTWSVFTIEATAARGG